MTPRVGEAGSQEIGHLLPFFIGEAGVLAVRLRVLEVDFLVGDVEVSADDDRFFLMEGQEVVLKVVFPLHAVRQAGQFALRIGGVAGDEEVVVKLEGNQTPFVIVFVLIHAVTDGQGLDAGEDGRAAVALAVGVVPILFVARKVDVDLAFLEFRFLQAEQVGVEVVKCI